MAYQPTTWEHGDIITGRKLNKIEQELTHVADNATFGFGGAQLSSDGLTPLSYINAGDPMPSNPQKGDTVFLKDGNDFLIYSYNGEDWVLRVDPDLSNRIEDTIKTASDNTDKAIADNNTQINETINQVAKEQADLAVKDSGFEDKAQAMADKALSDAKDNTATVAKSTLDAANQSIADAKKSVSDDLSKEVADRASAVSALDTKAQGYADTAKKNAIDVATSADGVINKKIDDTASSITSTVSQNKKDAEGKISTAQSTATQALTGLSSKVDTSTYNAKTEQLTTDVTNVTQTANQAKTDIASIKQTDTSQDARMTTIEADANGTKTTVSNLQKTQNTQSGSISTLQQRADGFDATVETINGATAKAQLTADQATTALNNYKTDADGRITKAQSDITQTAKDVTTKVSQTDYDKKTGDLSTSVSKAQQTADSAVTTIGNYKTSNDNRVKATETSIAQNTKDINLRATTSDLNAAKSDYNAQISQINVNVNGINSTVSSLQTSVNDLNQINQIPNTEFTPDFSGWHDSVDQAIADETSNISAGWYRANGRYNQSVALGKVISNGLNAIHSDLIPVGSGITVSGAIMAYSNTDFNGTVTVALDYAYYDSSKKLISSERDHSGVWNAWQRLTGTHTTPTNTAYIAFGVVTNGTAGVGYFSQPILVFSPTVGKYVAGVYSPKTKFATQQITIDGITTDVSNQGTSINSLTTRVQTAEGTLSTATDNISGLQSKQTQTANQITQEISDRANGDSNTLQSAKNFTQSSITASETGMKSTITQTSNAVIAQIGKTNLITNSEYDPLNYGWYLTPSVGQTIGSPISLQQATQFSDWVVVGGSRGIAYNTARQIVSEPTKIQVGQKLSASVIAGRSDATNGPSNTLDVRLSFFDSNKNFVSDLSFGNPISNIASKAPQLYKLENVTPPSNAYYVGFGLAHSGTVNDAIYRPMINFGSSVFTYSPTYGTSSSSTVLSLFKDNWSIGIADNIGKISNGIAADSTSMNVISKKVVIDSPETQITGTAWINSAMIANGAIGSAQIGDATITSAKIATLDVAKLTGNVSNFIQSNWNGLYQSVKISPIGMTISTSQGSTAQFNQDGLVLDGALGTTNVLNGQIELISSKNEYLGTFQHETMPDHDNVDYLMIKLAGWHTSKPGDSDYDLNSDSSNTIRGGDGIGFGVTNSVGTYDMKMSWDSSLVAGYKGRKAGWHVEDTMTWHQPAYFEGGFDVAQQFSSSDRRALHIQGATLSNGHKWFGFFDTPSQAGFGTDDTNDVLFYVKGKSYSLYTMLSKLSML